MKSNATTSPQISLRSELPVSHEAGTDTNFPAAPTVSGERLTVENAIYLLDFNPENEEFFIRHKPSGRLFIKNGTFEDRSGKATLTTITNKYLGRGRGIEILYPNGNRASLALYGELPFVVFDSTRHNATSEPQVLNRVPFFSAEVDAGADSENVTTLGTGGLLSPAKNPGSYAFLAIADSAGRRGVVGGYLTHDRGSGVVFSPVVDGTVRMEARVDFGRLRIKSGHDSGLETFVLGWFDDARFGLEAYADAIARVYEIKLPPKMTGFCTWYMEKHGRACDEKHLKEVAAVAASELKPFGFDFIQIDDDWQEGTSENGPKKNFTTHAPTGPYPAGMKAAAENISKLGLVPGIWFMPFSGNIKDPHFKDHHDWFAKNTEGQSYETAWGGTCLDMTNPETQAYVGSIVRRIAHDWGYKFFKMDGYWTGSATKQIYVNDGYKEDGMGDAVLSNPDKTNIEALRDGSKLVREAAGPDVFLLGCAITQNMRTFGGSFGLLDAMRVGPDTLGEIGSLHGSRLWFLNGRVWWNDPDCVFVRRNLTINRARLNASWTAIADQLFYISDWLPNTPADRMEIVKRCIPSHGLPARPVDVFDSNIPKIWLLTDTRSGNRRDVVGLYNWDKNTAQIYVSTDKIGLPPASEYVGFDFWANMFVPPFREKITMTLPPESCLILSVRPAASVPQLVSTSRHITQGIMDVTGETWNEQKAMLSGVSRVVANDPHELRIVVPVGKSWRALRVQVSPADAAVGVQTSFVQDGPRIRTTLTSTTNREIEWGIEFEQAEVEVAPPAPVQQLKAKANIQAVTLSWAPDSADSYRVQRNDGIVFETNACSIEDFSVEVGNSYQYHVAAQAWGAKVSAPCMVEITFTKPECLPAPPPPTIRLEDLEKIGWSRAVTSGKSTSGSPLQIHGKTYTHGIGVFTPANLTYRVPAGATRFVAVVGLDDAVMNELASVIFKVYGDAKEMGEQPVLIVESPVLSDKNIRSWTFDFELNTRFKELQLVVSDSGNGNVGTHADWVDAGFIVGPQSS